MKQVIIREESHLTVNLDEVSDEKFYGTKDSLKKYQIRKYRYFHPGFGLFPLKEFTTANSTWESDECKDLKSYLKALIRNEFEIFEFDTLTEFAQWFEKE